MPREIKFRAWDKNKRFMFYAGSLSGVGDFYLAQHKPDCNFYERFVTDYEWMQYTGIKVNDQEIYEGDIIEFELQEDSCWGDVGIYRDRVGFRDGEFVIDYSDEPDSLANLVNFAGEKWVKVIGNIYENPELLEVEK